MEYSNKNEEEDVFDKLADHLLDLILNKIEDAKSLCNSLSVCKRFHSLIPKQTHTVSLALLHPRSRRQLNTNKNSDDDPKIPTTSPKSNFLNKLLFNPLKSLVAAIRKSSRSHCECKDHEDEDEDENTFDLVSQALKNFNCIRSLEIELPGHNRDEIRPNLLKWKAEFGEKFESCVILGATSSSIVHTPVPHITINKVEKDCASGSSSSSYYFSEDELKDRVVWVISCLMAASARHYMMKKVVKEHREVERLVIRDGSNQGSICMNKRQIEETRESESESGELILAERSRMPGLRMKLWYVPELELELGGGSVMILKGATLVIVRPKEELKNKWGRGTDTHLIKETFTKKEKDNCVFREAAMKMVKKKRTYTLEMNSF